MGFSISSANAAILNVDASGQLLGAAGVDVGGTLYDVTFMDGSCADVFSGCNEAGDFTFQTEVSATAASAALFGQVLLDVPQGGFDSKSELTVAML